jgi:hypothetical protein
VTDYSFAVEYNFLLLSQLALLFLFLFAHDSKVSNISTQTDLSCFQMLALTHDVSKVFLLNSKLFSYVLLYPYISQYPMSYELPATCL